MSQNDKDKKYPISEIFNSPQGEGVYTGVMMTFIRTAGCTVGKPFPKENYLPREEQTFVGLENMPAKFPIYTEKCTLWDGREFACDTDYRVKERLTVQEILERIPESIRRVCVTGGEPLMHDLLDLFTALTKKGKFIHLETSGTKNYVNPAIWVTVAPKKGCTGYMISTANELKFLVDEDFDPESLIPDTLERIDKLALRKPVYLHPVNYEHTINAYNVKLCKKYQEKYPQFRIGLQFHKAMEMVIGEHVR